MTSNLEPQPDSPNSSLAPAVSVTLAIPADVAQAIREQAKQLGRSPASLIVQLLRSGLGLASANPDAATISGEDWQQVATRLAALEALIPRVTQLEEIASQFSLKTANSTQPQTHAALVDPPVQPTTELESEALELCPRCDRKLGAPLKSSGRKVCSHCGWSDRPRQAPSTPPATELSDADLQSLLAKATEESLQNIKRNKNAPKPGDRPPRFPKLPPLNQ